MECKYVDSLSLFITQLSAEDLKRDKYDIYNLWSSTHSVHLKDKSVVIFLTNLIDEIKEVNKSVDLKKFIGGTKNV